MFKTTMSTFSSTTKTQSTREETAHEVKKYSKKRELHVFLGGSCNPTTWRQNLAIPYLERNGISYYNPQIDNWTPEVVELEHRAKQDAQILLFVIDDQTRATVTLIESAFMAGDDKNIVFVFHPFESEISNTSRQSIEAYSLHETHQRMMKASSATANNTDSLVCAETSSSMSSTALLSKADSLGFKLASSYTRTSKSSLESTKVESSDRASRSRDQETREKFERLACCSLRLAGESISVEEFRELKQARSILKNLIDMRKIPTFPDIPQALNHISCHIRSSISGLRSGDISWSGYEPYLEDILLRRNSDESNICFTGRNDEPHLKDVYLSIDCDDSTIMDSTVIPILEASGLSYNYMCMKNIEDHPESIHESSLPRSLTHPKSSDNASYYQDVSEDATNQDQALRLLSDSSVDKAELAIEKELNAIRTSKVLLFVITNKCRGLSIMVLASHFMALLRNNVVLCVQYLEEPCTIGGENLSKTAIADYNRGRVYLCDDALKSRVPVFSTLREAIECCIRKCQHIK